MYIKTFTYIISVFLVSNNPLHIAVQAAGSAKKRAKIAQNAQIEAVKHQNVAEDARVGAVSCTGNSNILGIGLDSPIPNIKKNYRRKI